MEPQKDGDRGSAIAGKRGFPGGGKKKGDCVKSACNRFKNQDNSRRDTAPERNVSRRERLFYFLSRNPRIPTCVIGERLYGFSAINQSAQEHGIAHSFTRPATAGPQTTNRLRAVFSFRSQGQHSNKQHKPCNARRTILGRTRNHGSKEEPRARRQNQTSDTSQSAN